MVNNVMNFTQTNYLLFKVRLDVASLIFLRHGALVDLERYTGTLMATVPRIIILVT